MGSREDRLLQEKLQRMADLGVEPAPLPPAGAVPAWSPDDIVDAEPADEIAGGDARNSPDTSEEGPIRKDGLSPPAMPPCEIPNEGHYIGLRNGSQPGPDGWKPAVTPAEERMIFGAPVNRTVAEVEGTHGSPELDADAEKLIAMGQDPGPMLADMEDDGLGLGEPDFAEVGEIAPAPPGGAYVAMGRPGAAEVLAAREDDPDVIAHRQAVAEALTEATPEELGIAPEDAPAPAWAAGDLCIYADGMAEIIAVDEDDGLIRLDEVWPVPMKNGFRWQHQTQYRVDPARVTQVASDIGKLLAEAYRQHKAALAAESAAAAAAAAAERLVKAHFALADASAALAEIGQTVAITAA